MGSKAIKKIANFVLPQLGAVGGAANGLIQGQGLSGALKGGLQSGLNAALQIGGAQLGSALAGSGSLGSILGSAGGKLGAGGMGPPTPATGIIGALTKGGSSGGGGLLSALTGSGGLGGIVQPASNIFSGIQAANTQEDMEEDLLRAQGKSLAAVQPYLSSGTSANNQLSSKLASGELGGEFDPGDLTQDPGYQFRLSQGTNAINRSLGAQGSLFSGKALKAAQDYGQGLADSTYNDAYQRWLQSQGQTYNMLSGQAGQGLQAAQTATGIYDNEGNIKANATLGKNNIMTQTLSNLLSGSGARQIVGRRADGTPIYAGDIDEMEDA